MKLTPTLMLAMTVAAGIAGAAAAQTATTGTPSPYTSPAISAAPMQPGSSPMAPSASQTQQQPAQPMAAASPSSAAAPMTSGGDQQVRDAQQRLQAAGLYNGPVDGLMDPDTRAALARYQQQHGLRRPETLDQATLADLMNQPVGSGSTTPATTTPGPAPSAATGSNAGKSTAR